MAKVCFGGADNWDECAAAGPRARVGRDASQQIRTFELELGVWSCRKERRQGRASFEGTGNKITTARPGTPGIISIN
jgi:hypothetical protein